MEGADITGRLADFIVGTTYADLTADAVSAAKRMFLDLLGCGIAGTFYAAGEIRPVVKIAAELGGREECTLLAGGRKSSWFNAVLVNGACMHSIDYDDTRPGPITHTGAVVVPATLAFCEKLQRSGKDAILNAVLAYEAVSRIGTSVMPSHYDFWHSTGTNGTFGGTVAAGKLLALNAAQMETALGIAADQAAGLITCLKFGDSTKSLHAGLTGAKGALAALLAKNGATGPRGILEISPGYCDAFSARPQPEKIVQGLGQSFDIVNNCPKFYPSILGGHCIIAAILKIVRANRISAEDVRKVITHTFTIAVTKSGTGYPASSLAARMNMAYAAAAAILDHELGMRQFEAERLQDDRIRALMDRIELVADPALDRFVPEMYPANVRIVTTDGRVFQAEERYPKGFPQNPISDDELERKFDALCGTVFPPARTAELKDMIKGLEHLDNVADLMRLLAVK